MKWTNNGEKKMFTSEYNFEVYYLYETSYEDFITDEDKHQVYLDIVMWLYITMKRKKKCIIPKTLCKYTI